MFLMEALMSDNIQFFLSVAIALFLILLISSYVDGLPH